MVSQLSKIKGLEYSIGDIEKINLNFEFDALLSLFHVISYQTTNKKLLGVFQNAKNHLKKGGLFIFDVWYSCAVNSIKPSTRVKRFSNKKVEITKIAEDIKEDNFCQSNKGLCNLHSTCNIITPIDRLNSKVMAFLGQISLKELFFENDHWIELENEASKPNLRKMLGIK